MKPFQVRTYVKSATHFSSGRVAVKSRCRRSRGELGRGLVLDRRAWPGAAPVPDQALLPHHASDVVATDLDVTPFELLPGLAGPVGAPVAGAGRVDLLEQLTVGELAR